MLSVEIRTWLPKDIQAYSIVSSQKGGDKPDRAESVTRRASGGSRIRLELPRIIERIHSIGDRKFYGQDMLALIQKQQEEEWIGCL